MKINVLFVQMSDETEMSKNMLCVTYSMYSKNAPRLEENARQPYWPPPHHGNDTRLRRLSHFPYLQSKSVQTGKKNRIQSRTHKAHVKFSLYSFTEVLLCILNVVHTLYKMY